VGAHLAMGIPLLNLGIEIEPATVIRLDLPSCTKTYNGLIGHIQYIDRFGTLITNILGASVRGHLWSVAACGKSIPGCKTYGDYRPGSLVAIEGSHGFIEIAINGGSAQNVLQMGYRSLVHVIINQ